MIPRSRFWLVILAVILFGRMFQSSVVWPEETLYLAAAQQIHAGHILYKDIWFDKPPLLAWLYLGAFHLAGYSVYGLRLLGAGYICAVALAGFVLARRLWGESEGLWAAFFFAFFTAFYIPAATVALAADLLLLLPSLAVFYFLALRAPAAEEIGRGEARQETTAMHGPANDALAGICAGIGFHINIKALFVLAAAAAWVVLEAGEAATRHDSGLRRRPRLAWLLGGFVASTAAGLGIVAAQGGWQGYIDQVWRWGWFYARSPLSDHPWALGLERTLHYLGFHAALALGAAAYFRLRPGGSGEARRLAAWMTCGLAAAMLGGRFFPRYYFQLLAPLALAAGAGWSGLWKRRAAASTSGGGLQAPLVARAAPVVLAAALAVPAVRFGRVNLWLALRRPFAWTDRAMDADSRRVGADVAGLTQPGDKILVWGYRPEIYFYSRRIGASRYLESQPLTGVLADRHLQRSDAIRPELSAQRRLELARELLASPPAVIVDGLGPYNPSLAIERYPELREPLALYRVVEATRGARIYRLRKLQPQPTVWIGSLAPLRREVAFAGAHFEAGAAGVDGDADGAEAAVGEGRGRRIS